jgi:hypothetical protein
VVELIEGLVLMTSPFQHVLGLIPKGVLAGLFVCPLSSTPSRSYLERGYADEKWYMGTDALLTSGVTEKMLYLIRDKRSIEPTNPLNKVRTSRILMFLAVELIGFGATFAVTQVCPFFTFSSSNMNSEDQRRRCG